MTLFLDKLSVSVKQILKVAGDHFCYVLAENISPEGISPCSLDPEL